MHRSHLGLCALGVLLALGYLVLTGGSASGVGLLIATLACPLAMILAMSVLTGSNRQQDRTTGSGDAPAHPVEHP